MKQFLILDAAEISKKDSILIKKKTANEQTICHYHILKSLEKNIKRKEGDYFTIEFSSEALKNNKLLKKEMKKILSKFLKKYHHESPILIIGLGNPNLLVDSLGSNVTDKLIATNQYNDFLTIPKVALFNPDVTSKTGISSHKLIDLLVKDLKPDLMIIIDSLATNSIKNLNRVIEISDAGIIPGSAIRANKEINKDTFHIPILSIGVPLLYQTKNNLLESIYLKEEMNILSEIIASSLNEKILF